MLSTFGTLLTVSLALLDGAPRSCTTSEVAFRSGAVTLAGTLNHPGGARPPAAMVLVHGSGRVDRASMRWMGNLL
jgi:hypothetical protein